MNRVLIIQYLYWHFLDIPKEILKAWKNFLWFNLNYFSVPTLIKTYFSYWRGYSYSYGGKWEPMRWLEAFVFNNIMSRPAGVIFRTIFIILGILFEILIFLIGIIIFIGWLLLPLLLIFGFLFGIGIMI
ncbi:MAG: hypothetical protein ABH956_03680 [Candidatus Nealsonbacteria bacterium]